MSGIVVLITLVAAVSFLLGWQKRPATATLTAPVPAADGSAALASSETVASTPTGRGGLTQIFQRSMLGAQVAYLERLTGPARNVDGRARTYVVTGCEVMVTVEKGAVRSLGLPSLSPKCTVSLADFGFDGPLPNKATFGMFDELGFKTRYTADCLRSCGNAYDPSVYATVSTPHSNGFLTFRVGAVQSSDQALDAANKWEQVMEAAEGEDWLVEARFNCTDRYDAAAARALRDVRITSIEVGSFDVDESCS
ncbi:MAG: hypothetical protein U0987_11350 [Afipia sp.]|nr:hypothetical protein [Afipia sp.]